MAKKKKKSREKTRENPAKDPVTGHFLPGNDGGPGRTPGVKNFTTAVREALLAVAEGKAETNQVLIVKKVMEKAGGGDVPMIKTMWEQLDGRPAMKLVGSIGGVIATTSVSNQKAKELLKDFNKQLRDSLNLHDDEPDDSESA